MTSRRFFISQDQIRASRAVLEGDEHHHLSRVSRIRKGERVWLFDENGSGYLAEVDDVTSHQTRLRILEERRDSPASPKILLAMAVIKAPRMEWVLQKGTELGMFSFIPVHTARGVVKWAAAAEEKKMARWKRIVREAAKQSGRFPAPEVSPPTSLPSLLEESRSPFKLFLYERAETRLRDVILSRRNTRESRDEAERDITILVGPEGGWTNAEAEDIVGHGFEAVSLGDSILRAETAAICCLAMLNQFWI